MTISAHAPKEISSIVIVVLDVRVVANPGWLYDAVTVSTQTVAESSPGSKFPAEYVTSAIPALSVKSEEVMDPRTAEKEINTLGTLRLSLFVRWDLMRALVSASLRYTSVVSGGIKVRVYGQT